MTILMGSLRDIDGMIMYKCRRFQQLQGISGQYQEATEASEKKEREENESKNRYVSCSGHIAKELVDHMLYELFQWLHSLRLTQSVCALL